MVLVQNNERFKGIGRILDIWTQQDKKGLIVFL